MFSTSKNVFVLFFRLKTKMTGKRKGNKQSSMLSFLKPKIPRLTEAGIRDAAAKV